MDNKIPNMDYDADEVINEFKEKIKWPKSDEVTAVVKPSKMPLRVFISLIITAIAGGVAYYMMLPAFNIKDTQMYLPSASGIAAPKTKGYGQNIVHSLIHIITAWEAAF